MTDTDSTFDKVAGKAKEGAGKVTGDKDLEAEGKLQHAEGKAKEALDDAGDKVKDAVDDARAGLHALGERIKGHGDKDHPGA